MNDDERKIMDALVLAWNGFVKINHTHPSHLADFQNGIHSCQNVIMHKIVQRDYPEDFPSHEAKP